MANGTRANRAQRRPGRPLLLAGPAAILGAWLPLPAGVPLLAALIAAALFLRKLLPLGVAMFAWVAASTAQRSVATPPAWPRAPPRLSTCTLDVLAGGEDPFRNRSWCRGRRGDGTVITCSWEGDAPRGLLPGARIAVKGRFYLSRTAGNPGERAPPAGLRADLRNRDNIRIVAAAPAGPRAWFARLRRASVRRLARGLPRDVGPLAAALLLGVRTGQTDTDRLRFERTGTMHMLAISGLHLILLAGLVHGLLRRLGAGPRTAALVTLLLAWAYVPLTGAATPVRRAVTVLTTYGLALVRGRTPDAWSALSGAALVLALVDPDSVHRVGFYLSFCASAGILFLAPRWRERWGRRHRLLARFPAVRADRPVALRVQRYVLSALPVSLAAWLATQAIAADGFGSVTPLAPLTNLVAGPLLAALLPATGLYALGLDTCSAPVTFLARALHGLLDFGAGLPLAYLFVAAVPAAALVAWGSGVLLLRRWPGPALACLLFAAGATWARRSPRELSVHLFDVGHGQAALIRFDDGAAVLVDAGSRTRHDLARRALLPALRELGVRRLRAVVCTHADADHWNALPSLLGRVPVDRILGSEPIAAERLRPGDTIHATRQAKLAVLAAGGPGSRNDRSVALLLEVGGERVVFPADREEDGLHGLLAVGLPRCDVLVAPHHGARCTAAFAVGLATRPNWLLVSAARGFPDPETLRAYRGRTLQTWEAGCLTIRFGPVRVERYRAASTSR